MSAEGATEALVAAFFFGIVLNAASATLILYAKGYGLAAMLRDSQRLVLALFLLSAALWAQIDFITILLDVSTSSTPCQIGIIFSTVFDQFARFSIEQFLLWALNSGNGAKLSAMQLVAQGLVLVRFLAGAVFIGFTRPQTDTFCVATTSAPPVGILVTALDGVIILFLVIQAYSAGGVAKGNRQEDGSNADRSRAIMSVLLGLFVWTGTSVPLLLGITTLSLATRTAVPAGGLLVLLAFIASGVESLPAARTIGFGPPEAPSPRRINISRDISSSDTDYPPTRYEDLKEAALRSSTTFVNPRAVPRVKDETSIGMARGVENGLRGEPVPPLPSAMAVAPGLARGKGLFDLGKGKLAISRPILQENAAQNPLNKIAVVDLAQAAAADRERRARMQEEEVAVFAGRSAGQMMGMAPEEVMKRGVSLKRKEVASVASRESAFAGSLRPESAGVALTTSAQLSPGGEEARRRSPRPSVQEDELVQLRSASPVRAPEPVKPRSTSPPNPPANSQQPLLRNDIRPSRMLPPSPKAPPPEPTKTPLQRRPTVGLPTNPRARGLKVDDEAGTQHRTILFLNNIEYDDPAMVDSIIKTAGNNAAKLAPVVETPGTANSVVNRPRPVPRRPTGSPAQPSPFLGHRRSKSGGSLISRKSLLAMSSGSPTQLPPLPSLPRSATMPARPHPNDTKSMTFDEKVTMLFPRPTSANGAKRKSSVPEVPRIPASYLDMDSSPSDSSDPQRSNRTTKTSVRTESVLEVDEIPSRPGQAAQVNTTNETGSSWLRAFGKGSDDGKSAARRGSGKRASSPIIPEIPVRASAWTETTYDRSEDDATNWSAMPSPELAVSVPVMQRLGAPMPIEMPARQDTRVSHLSSVTGSRSSDILTVMLDTGAIQEPDVQEPVVAESEVVTTSNRATWHRRVGDECPTFSARKEKTRSRKGPPPAPLSLNGTAARKAIVIQAEPSPLESPEQAIRQIQAQLKKLEDYEQASPQSASKRLALLEDLEREMGQQAEHWQEIKHDIGRDSLSSMQTSSRRESVASVATALRDSAVLRQSIGSDRRNSRMARMMRDRDAPKPEAPTASVRNSASPQLSRWQKRLTEAQMDYMDARLLNGNNASFLQVTRAQLASPTPPDSDDSEHSDYEVQPSLATNVTVKQPSVEQPKAAWLWAGVTKSLPTPTGLLWTPVSKTVTEPEASLPGLSVRPAPRKEWAPLQIKSSQLWRKPYDAANRSTSDLWRPVWASAAPPAAPVVRATSTKITAQPQKPPRPVTQRPPRRNKRVTLLPDILENPEPLPDNRGTLGIFQFPWGEKSDTASLRPRPSMYMAMPGTMASGGPSFGAPPRQTELTEYSSSFFDDYDEDGNDAMNSDEDGDDAFDDTTLWEIASLLKTDSVPSRDSLLPSQSDFVVDDYMDELASIDEAQSPREESIVIGLGEPRDLLFDQQRDSATIESSTLLMLEETLEPQTPPAAKPAPRLGLPGNPKALLKAQVDRTAKTTPAAEMSRTTGHTAEVQEVETATQLLWNPPSQVEKPTLAGGLFTPGASGISYRDTSEEPAAKYMSRKPRPTEKKPLDRLMSTKLWSAGNEVAASQLLWSAPTSNQEQLASRGGLFAPGSTRPSYRGTFAEPAAKYMTRKPRPAEKKPLARLSSTKLWKPMTDNQSQHNWILGAPKAKLLKSSGAHAHLHRSARPQFSGEDWTTALNEAVAASYPHRAIKRARLAASPFEWKAALHEAISLSARQQAPAFDPAVRHPVFAAQSLITQSEYFHPAATGYTHDVAAIHPVFFGSRAVPDSHGGVHPAFSSHAATTKVRKQQQQSAPAPVPEPEPVPSSWHRDPIQAQIEALEQERLFVQRAAQEEYRRRTSATAAMATAAVMLPTSKFAVAAPAQPATETGMGMERGMEREAMPVGAQTVQDLQRHLSQQIRMSLVLPSVAAPVLTAKPVAAAPLAPATAAPARALSQRKTPLAPARPSRLDENSKGVPLWTRPAQPVTASTANSSTGLWLPRQSTVTVPSVSATISSTAEDAAVADQRALRRRAMQEKRRLVEEEKETEQERTRVGGVVGMWTAGAQLQRTGSLRGKGLGRDWLGSVCVRETRTRGVVLRY